MSLLALLTGCGPASVDAVPVACSTDASLLGTRDIAPGDTLDVVLRFDSLPPDGRVLLRVDGLDEDGVVRFRGSPSPSTAAAGVSLTSAGIFQGCVSRAPTRFVMEATHAPARKAWVRVSAARPVRVQVEQRGPGGTWTGVATDEPLVVAPGASGWTGWRAGSGT